MKKRGQDVPGPSKKVLGLLDFFSPGTTGPSRSLGPVLFRPVLGHSRDFPGWDSPAVITTTYLRQILKNLPLLYIMDLVLLFMYVKAN